MLNFTEIFIYSDQPTTCPKCGLRSEIVLDLLHEENSAQVHKCSNNKCEFEFVMQDDEDFDNSSLL